MIVYEMRSYLGDEWRAMSAPNPTSILYRALRADGDEHVDSNGNTYRLRCYRVALANAIDRRKDRAA